MGLLERDRRGLDILSVKKEAKLSATEIPAVGIKRIYVVRVCLQFARGACGLSEDVEYRSASAPSPTPANVTIGQNFRRYGV